MVRKRLRKTTRARHGLTVSSVHFADALRKCARMKRIGARHRTPGQLARKHLAEAIAHDSVADVSPAPSIEDMPLTVRHKLVLGVLALCVLAAVYWALHATGAVATITDKNALHDMIVHLGAWGPLTIIALMILAILVSPIPSAPIALASGAAYGHWWGTLYILLGSEAGALAAFGIARLAGHEAVHRWFGNRLKVGLFGSQNALMAIVFISRVLPFMSFDIVSYAAGLTVLSAWRFAIATLAGVAPISFLLAHVGTELATGETKRIFLSVLLLGMLTMVPIVVELVRARIARRRVAATGKPK